MKQLNVFESRKIRDLFVNSFVDQTTERYKMIKEIDSQNVSLYLWDTLLKPFSTIVNYYSAINHLQNSSNKVFLMMDIQRRNRGSEETQFNLYLKKHNYEREAVFELPASEVAELYRIDNEINTSWMPSDLNLLEDIYVFDESFKWLIVFTHEQVDLIDTNYHRLCFSNLLMKPMILEFEDYPIDVDEEKMKTLAHKKYRCQCPPCRTFREYASALSSDLKHRFDALGLDLENPDEVYDFGKDEKGNPMYVAWWNLYGKIKNSEKPCCISDNFEISFYDEALYTPKWFQDSPCVQMRAVIRGSNLKPLGKKYWRDTDALGISRNTFQYHIADQVCSALKDLVGCELIGLDAGSTLVNDEARKCHKVNIYIKHPNESDLRVVSLMADRDIDTCFDGIDRMVFTANISKAEMELAVDEMLSCPQGKIQKINIFESTIAGKKDSVIYDSHLLIELESGKKMIFRIEPDSEEVFTVFTEVEDRNIEAYLRVSDTWFLHSYQTETKVRM